MKRQEVIEKLRQIGEATLPPGTSLYLYGSRARNDSHEGSDWDIMILLNKERLNADDYGFGYPFREFGWDINEDINPTVFAKGHWEKYPFLPFYKNVEHDKIVLI